MDRLRALWAAIPRPVRTILNVGIYGSLLVVIGAVIAAQGVTGVDWPATGRLALDAFGLGIATAIGRALAPWDAEYGISKDAG